MSSCNTTIRNPSAEGSKLEEASQRFEAASNAWLAYAERELRSDSRTIPPHLELGNELYLSSVQQIEALKQQLAHQQLLLDVPSGSSSVASPGGTGPSSQLVLKGATPPALSTAVGQCSRLMLQLAECQEELQATRLAALLAANPEAEDGPSEQLS